MFFDVFYPEEFKYEVKLTVLFFLNNFYYENHVGFLHLTKEKF